MGRRRGLLVVVVVVVVVVRGICIFRRGGNGWVVCGKVGIGGGGFGQGGVHGASRSRRGSRLPWEGRGATRAETSIVDRGTIRAAKSGWRLLNFRDWRVARVGLSGAAIEDRGPRARRRRRQRPARPDDARLGRVSSDERVVGRVRDAPLFASSPASSPADSSAACRRASSAAFRPVASSPRAFSSSLSCATVIVLGSVIVKDGSVVVSGRLRRDECPAPALFKGKPSQTRVGRVKGNLNPHPAGVRVISSRVYLVFLPIFAKSCQERHTSKEHLDRTMRYFPTSEPSGSDLDPDFFVCFGFVRTAHVCHGDGVIPTNS